MDECIYNIVLVISLRGFRWCPIPTNTFHECPKSHRKENSYERLLYVTGVPYFCYSIVEGRMVTLRCHHLPRVDSSRKLTFVSITPILLFLYKAVAGKTNSFSVTQTNTLFQLYLRFTNQHESNLYFTFTDFKTSVSI